jgi:hypothetical protein
MGIAWFFGARFDTFLHDLDQKLGGSVRTTSLQGSIPSVVPTMGRDEL